jgi:hypothetical protein
VAALRRMAVGCGDAFWVTPKFWGGPSPGSLSMKALMELHYGGYGNHIDFDHYFAA